MTELQVVITSIMLLSAIIGFGTAILEFGSQRMRHSKGNKVKEISPQIHSTTAYADHLSVVKNTNYWNVRIYAPRRLFRLLNIFLDHFGFKPEDTMLELDKDIFANIGFFKGEIIGIKDLPRRSFLMSAIGILLPFTIVLVPLGFYILRKARYSVRIIAKLTIEGEAYLNVTMTFPPKTRPVALRVSV